jgi:predicted porin
LTRVTQLDTCLWFNTSNFPKTEVGSEKFRAPVQTLENLEMKKTLVAIAALAAFGAQAQSSVTISGLLDASYSSTSGNGTTVSTAADTVNASIGSATSAINIAAVEDLGGGMKAQVFYGIDPRNMFANSTSSSLGRHEMYVGLSGGFGSIKLGSPNTAALSTMGAGQIFGTATGGAFANGTTAAGSGVRFNNSVRYDTPAFSGFSASVNYAPGNNDATAQTATLAAAPAITDIGLAYSNGPLNVNYSNLKRGAVVAATAAAQADGTASFGLAAVTAAEASTYQSLGANYTMGAFKVFAGYGKGDKSGASNADTKYNSYGASYTTGKTTILAGLTDATIGTAAKRKATGVRVDYALSKRTVAYIVNEAYDSGATSANKTNITAVGVRHSF